MLVLFRTTEEPTACQYLPDRAAVFEVQFVGRITPAEYESHMNTGWRKFGRILFRPRCEGCSECRPVRVPVEEFDPDRSQRRALKRNADLRVVIAPPRVDSARMSLWNRYHSFQSEQRGWPATPASAWNYTSTYVENPVPSLEVAAYDGDRLLGVALLDVTPSALSGIYHYYDPGSRERSLGKYLMLRSIQAARDLGKRYFYLGYYVTGCAAMEYKSNFRPCEILESNGTWSPFVPEERSNISHSMTYSGTTEGSGGIPSC